MTSDNAVPDLPDKFVPSRRVATPVFLVSFCAMFLTGSVFALNELFGFWADGFDVLFGIYGLLLAIVAWSRPAAVTPRRLDLPWTRLVVLLAGMTILSLTTTSIAINQLRALPIGDVVMSWFGRLGEGRSVPQILALATTGIGLIALSNDVNRKSERADESANGNRAERRSRKTSKKSRGRADRRRH